MKSTKFHTADENSLGRYVGINKSVRSSPPSPTGTKAGVGDSCGLFRMGDHRARSWSSRIPHAVRTGKSLSPIVNRFPGSPCERFSVYTTSVYPTENRESSHYTDNEGLEKHGYSYCPIFDKTRHSRRIWIKF